MVAKGGRFCITQGSILCVVLIGRLISRTVSHPLTVQAIYLTPERPDLHRAGIVLQDTESFAGRGIVGARFDAQRPLPHRW